MYESYWGLSASPFANRLDSRWYHASAVHDEAHARLAYLVEQRRSFGLLTGPAGTGKSLSLKVLCNQVRRTQRKISWVDLQGLDAQEMLWQTAAAMRLAPTASSTRWSLWRDIADQFEAQQICRTSLVFVFDHLDQADASCHSVMQRLLATSGRSGHVTFLASVRSQEVARLAPFLSELTDLRVELTPLEIGETEAYISDLLARAGGSPHLFTGEAAVRIHEFSHGCPRQINRLCELSLIAAMYEEREHVTADLIETVADGLVMSFDQGDVLHRQPQYV